MVKGEGIFTKETKIMWTLRKLDLKNLDTRAVQELSAILVQHKEELG